MIDVALLAALVVITTWATAATGFATLCWLKMRRALARIALLEDAIVELKSRPCLAPCAALLQREQYVTDMQETMRALARRIETLEDRLARTMSATMDDITKEPAT